VNIDVSLTDEDIDRIAARTVSMLASWREHDRWLDVRQAADHLSLSTNAVRALVKRRQIPFHRTSNGRLRFSVTELDHWVRTGSCAATHEDLR
jgi:excisionase family DNA binding protein